MKNFTKKMLNYTKICLFFLGFMFSGNTLLAQKVAVIGIDHSSPAANGGDYDGISFVATENLVAGTIFYFTNGLYDAPNTRFRSLSASDDGIKFIAKYTVPVGGIAKGVVVYIQETNQTSNTLATTCSSGSCGSATFLVYNGAASNFSIGDIVVGVWAYSDTDDNPLNGITTIHSVMYEGYYDSGIGTQFVGNLPANMDPIGSFPNAIVTDGLFSSVPVTVQTINEFKPTLRGGAVSKLNLEDPSNYNKLVSGGTSLSTTAFASLNLVNTNPTVGVAVSPSSVTENGATNLTYTFTLSANAASNITVNYTATGTATNGTDYGSITGSVVIASGTNTATVTVDPSGDASLEPDETVTLTITSGTGYDIGSPSSATGTITNDDTGTSLPKVALVGINQADAGVNPTHQDGFSFVALEDITSGTVVHFTRRIYDKTTLAFGNTFTGTVKWTAGAGVNRGDVYTVMETSADVFTVTCSDGSSCGAVANIDAGFTIPLGGITMFAYSDNNDNPTDGVTEIYSALHTGDLTLAGNGGAIPTNSNPSTIYPNAVVVDNFPNANPGRVEYKFPTERQVTVTRTLLTNVANWLHAQSTATALSTVRFTNIIVTSGVANPLVTVTPSPSSVLENSGSGMTYTFTLSQNAASNMTINFGVGGTATFTTDYTQTGAAGFTASTGSVVIPSGSNSASVTITPVSDATLEPNETVVLTIDTGTGYDAGSPSVATGTITNDDVVNVNPLVVIVGVNHGTSPDPDGISFAANQNLTAGTEIYFTDSPYNNTTLNFSTIESITKYTVPAGGLAKGQVVYIVETGQLTNAFTVSCSAGANCGTFAFISGDFSLSSNGEDLYAYTDTDADPTNGITAVHSLFYTINGAIPTTANPSSVFPNAAVVSGFGSSLPNRTEYKFAASERSATINLANIQNTANYLIAQTTQGLSVIPFAALNLCPASITTNPSNPAAFCPGGNTSFTVAASGSNLTYQWQVNTGSGFTDISNGGIYSGATSTTLTLTNVPFANNGFTYQCIVNACATSTAATLTVNAVPTASPSSNTPVCDGNTLNLTSSLATSYLWTGPNGFSATTQSPDINNVTIVAANTYTLRVTNVNGCTGTATTSVVINSTPAPTSPAATPSSRTTAGSVTLSATGCSGGTLTWYDAATNTAVSSPNNQPNLTSAGTFNFYAKCTGTNTCVSNASTNVPVTVTLCTPLASSPGNVGINWTGLESTDWNNACNWNPAWVPDATNSAVVIDLKTNQPTISGIVPSVKLIYVNSGATLTVSSGGTLNANSTAAVITLQGGNIINDGTINTNGSGSGVGISIGATASIINRGTISTNNLYGISLDFGNLTFTNESTGIVSGDFKANNNVLTLTNHGTINYGGGTFALSLGSSGSSVINNGTISITAGSGISNPSGSTITNNACGKILMTTDLYENGGTTTNAGLIQMPNLYNFTNTGTFTNNGVLKANTVSGITNNRMVITNACPIFTLAGSNNYTVSGIFTDIGATTSAGTYVSVGNKFTANNTIPTGTQTLYAQVTNGTCTFVVPFNFNNRKPTAVSVNKTVICIGGSVTLSGTCASGTLTWYTDATGGSSIGTGTSLLQSPISTTTYYAACEATNCVSGRVATSEVSVSSPPFASANSNSPICAGETLNLNSGSEGNTYLWTGPNSFTSTELSPSIANATVSATGTYTITITNASSCTATATVAVTINAVPVATASSNSPVCIGNTISLTGGGVGSYLWTGPGGYSSTSQSPTITNATVGATGTYTITVTGTGSCTSTATTAVTVNGLVTASVTPSTQTICSGGAITTIAITGTGTSYTWTRDNTTSATGIAASGSGDISGSLTNTTDAPITVTFTITPVGACNGTPITATVVVNPIPTATASTPSQSVCSGTSITGITFNTPPPLGPLLPNPSSDILPTAPASTKGIVLSGPVAGTIFNWTRDNTATVTGIPASGSGNISGTLTNTTASPITVTFTVTPSYTNAGTTCTGTPITVTVTVNPIPLATITDAGTAFCSGSSTTLSAPANAGATYAWERSLTGIANPNEFTAFGGTAQTQVVTTSGVYRVIVTKNNCSARDTTAVKFGDFVFSGSLATGDAQQTGRINRFAVVSTCAAPKSYPGDFTTSGARFYDSYTITNPTSAPICATIGLTSGCGTTLFSAAYLGSFNPASVGTNYLADHGSTFPNTAFYEATIPANGTIVVVVHEVNPGTGCSNYNLRVDVPGATVAPTASSNSPICAGNTLNLTGTGTGTYAWTGPNGFTSSAQNPSIANATTLATGTYTISVTNTNGCVFNATTAVTVNANPAATASSNSPICAGNTLNLTGGGVGTAYAWVASNGYTSTEQSPTISSATVLASGTYTITVTNANGCTSTASVVVTVNATPIATASSSTPVICAGNNIALTGGGVGTYLWSGPNGYTSTAQSPTINNATVSATGTYTITVTASTGCTSTASVAITVNALPTATASTSTPSICAGTTISLTGGGVGTYAWSGPNGYTSSAQSPTIANATVLASGVYRIIVTNANNCTSTSTTSVTVNPVPVVVAGANQTICEGSTASLTATCNLLTVSTTLSGASEVPANASTATGTVSGTFDKVTKQLLLTISFNGLTANASAAHIHKAAVGVNGGVIIGFLGVPAATSGSFTYSGTLTAGQETDLLAGLYYVNVHNANFPGGEIRGQLSTACVANNFVWNPENLSGQTVTVSPSTTQLYTVTASNTTTGCSSTATTIVNVNARPVVTIGSNTPICAGNALNLTTTVGSSDEPSTFAWTGPNSFTSTAQSPTIISSTVSASGTYTVTVTNVSGCITTATTAVIINANPTATASSNSPICAGNTLNLIGGGVGTYSWTSSNGFTSTDQNPSISNATVSTSGTYTITVTNASGCTSTASVAVTVNPTPTATASSNSPICAGNTLNLTGGGVGTYSWTSSNGFTSTDQNPSIANATVSATGTYTITVTNVSGCTSTASVAVIVNANPTATASNNSPICSGVTLNLTGGGVGTYAWAGPSGYTSTAQSPSIASATASMSGVYTLIVTNVNGCTSMATTSVTVNPVTTTPTPQANTQIIFGASITLTATGCSGVNDVLKWYKTSDNSLAVMPVSPTATTNYYAKCETTLNGITCISGNSTDVTVTVLQPNPPVATGATNCLGTPTTLTATGCSGSVGTFVLKWYQNADDALVTMPVLPTTTTDYYAKCEQTFNAVTAISAKSNVVTLTILNPPTPVATGGTIYSGNSITLTATGCTGTVGTFTLKWYQTSDNVLVTMPVSPTATKQYYSKCEQTANSVTCLSAKSNDVTVTVVNRIFVDVTKIAAPIQNGNSWATAYGNLQTGLSAAAAVVVSAPAEVWVAQGTYKPTTTTTRTVYFDIPSSVKVYGGFAGTENALNDRNFRTNTTILSGDIGTVNLASDNSYHVVTFDGSSNTTVLDGFTITGGYANFDPRRVVNAPIAAPPTTSTIETGGGIVVQNAGSPMIANCTIVNNAALTGGGIYIGDASLPKIVACKIMSNQATFGAGVYFQDGSNGSLSNSLISGNRGIGAVYNNTSNPTITNCTIAGNGGYNGGIFNSASQPIVKNSIIWNNSTPFNDTQSIITYSTIQGGYAGTGNLNYDPKFVNPVPDGLSPNANGDYHVQASSLAIDRGDNTGISLTDTDLDGNLRRFNGGTVDMGAYEFQGTATSNIVISAQTGDWEINSTWVGFKVPALGDVVIIDANHIVTINATAIAKSIEYRATGQVKFKTAAAKLNIGF
jgi:hypothetical protein